MKKQIKLDFQTHDYELSVKADRIKLKQMLYNLTSNAVKFTTEQKNPEITIGYQPDQSNQRVIYYVKDNGVGLSMEDMDKVFDKIISLQLISVNKFLIY